MKGRDETAAGLPTAPEEQTNEAQALAAVLGRSAEAILTGRARPAADAGYPNVAARIVVGGPRPALQGDAAASAGKPCLRASAIVSTGRAGLVPPTPLEISHAAPMRFRVVGRASPADGWA